MEEILEKIVKIGNKWQVQSEKGRNMGTYDTKEEAEERLRQVHYFKYANEGLEHLFDEPDELNEAAIVKNFLSTFTGYENGEHIKDTDDVLLNYVDIDKSIKDFPELADLDVDKWPVFKQEYWFKCPRCGKEYPSTKYSMQSKCKDLEKRSRFSNEVIPASRIAWCGNCGFSDKPSQSAIMDTPELWDRIPDNIVDKTTGRLTDVGREEVYKLNKEKHPENVGNGKHQITKTFLDSIHNNKDFNFGAVVTKRAELYLPFVCPICGEKYDKKVTYVYNTRHESAGCPKCLSASTGANDSNSEFLLKDALDSITAFKLFEYKPEGFNKVDICLEYNGNKFAIEYDSKKAHNTEDKIDVDTRKTKKCLENGYKVIRVRDKACAPFPDGLAAVITLPSGSCFGYLGYDTFIAVIQAVCAKIGYRITKDDLENITNAFYDRSSAKAAKRARVNSYINKEQIQRVDTEKTAVLLEDNRAALINKSRNVGLYKDKSRGKNRFERKKYSKIATTVKQYNQIDMNKLFKQDILQVAIPVVGETDNYTVTIKMEGVIAELARNIKANNNKFEYKTIIQALTKIFNTTNIYVKCNCQDYRYRFAHWNIINNVSVDDTAQDPGPGKGIRNPKDEDGRGCKHVLLVLANGDWLMKVASVINNYAHYAEEKLQKPFLKVIFPKLYGIPADEMVEQGLIDDDKYLDSSAGLIDAINEYGKQRGRYTKGSNKNPVTEKEKLKQKQLLSKNKETTDASK